MRKKRVPYKKRRRSVAIEILKKKFKTNGIILALALISLLGFVSQMIFISFGVNIFGTFAYSSLILGVGLIAESKIFKLLQGKAKRVTDYAVTKMITALVGIIVAIGGLITLPFLGINIQGTFAGILLVANLIAIIVIIYEIFWVD